ncbi:MAG: hypothetical protein E5X21_04665 [Mesorhizobium sp.]|uniref:hypothetical protein n=1 Tax=unclassified Mesorhizobium TaxID=325217 RepID=UPI000FD559FA|nr:MULTISPECIES: hypothetical protein [unclassified Mesorhizobium]RUV71216.1 hypothetical protein EOA50_22890 [Mesorhizobium sp. M1A.F.Ca.IN.020.30.1.1]MCT2575701.1 hypothetical protein [Mesorhizobium sp. P13.3]MDF3182277.1 hypothetical protein [Mesorhizobium sp. ICCV3110.1]RWG22852.1 MAG: hypothetical protein EOQ53_05640 [Mesorhizobium sp.]RWG33368.1 MAG: hypothetical protein EOQ60_11715 [Mesorhizobium sp.]
MSYDTTTKPTSTDSWRLKVDRAWRSDQMRQRFENESGISPVDETSPAQIESGEVADYYEQFAAWAIKTLGIRDEVPAYARPD